MPEKFAAIYARQSLDKKDSLSIEGQIELCKTEVRGEFRVFEDKGFSGKNTKRPAFVQLLHEIEAGNVTRLVCYRLDRISRSILDFGTIWDTLSRNGVEFVSVNEKFDTSTPVGRAMLYIIMVFAQLERETIAERVKDNYYQRVKKGAFPGGPAPYGMRIADKRSNGVCTLEPAEEIMVVKRIFEMYAVDGMSLGKVAKKLSDEGIPAAKRKTWDNISVYRVLRNPAYVKATADIFYYYKSKGLIIYNQPEEFTGECAGSIVGKRLSNERKYTDMTEHLFAIASHEGIIDSDLFLLCQYRLDGNKQIKNTGSGKYSWLSGLLHCAECGYSLKVMNDHYSGRLKLYCSGRANFHACDLKHTEKVEDIEAYVEQDIMRYMKDTLENGVKQENIKAEQNTLKAYLYQIEEKINNLVKAMADGNAITIKYVNGEISRLDKEREATARKLAEMAIPKTPTEYIVDFSELSFEDKKLVASSLVKTVICSPDGISVVYKQPAT